jgi:hypothetical protein
VTPTPTTTGKQPETAEPAPPKTGGRSNGSPIARVGPDQADEFPLPLIILAAIAVLLMAAGAAGLIARRARARRANGPGDPRLET